MEGEKALESEKIGQNNGPKEKGKKNNKGQGKRHRREKGQHPPPRPQSPVFLCNDQFLPTPFPTFKPKEEGTFDHIRLRQQKRTYAFRAYHSLSCTLPAFPLEEGTPFRSPSPLLFFRRMISSRALPFSGSKPKERGRARSHPPKATKAHLCS